MAYRVAIIGAGRIGAMLDDPQSPHVLTHAHGYKSCEGFEIAGFIDRDPRRAEAASSRWGGRAFSRLENVFENQGIDVVSVCVPDELHCETMQMLAGKPVKLIFLEKPAVRTDAESRLISALYQDLPVRVLVNYTRRFLPEVRRIKRAIAEGDYGDFLTGTGYYGKGLLHNGSHLVDLLRFLLGEVGQVQKIGELEDFCDWDPSVSALLTLPGGGVFLARHVDCRKFDIFELDLTFERKRIRIRELGTVIEEYSVGDNAIFKGYRTQNKDAEYATGHQGAMCHAVANIRNHLEHDEPLVCPLAEALHTLETCLRIARGGV